MKDILKLDVSQLFGESIHVKESDTILDIGLHWHSYYELIYYYDGCATSCINGTNLELKSGSLYLLTPSDLHHTYPTLNDKAAHFINISFTEEVLDRELAEQLQQVIYIHNLAENENIISLINLLKNAKSEKEKQHLLNALLYCITATGQHFKESTHNILPKSIRQSIRYIANHFNEQITLDMVADALHLNESYFSSLFSKTYGCTFKTYLTIYRLGYAKQLLQNTDLSVTEICTASGFQTLPHFFRVFKQQEGITPLQFRKQAI